MKGLIYVIRSTFVHARRWVIVCAISTVPGLTYALTTVSPTGGVGIVYGPNSVQFVDGVGSTSSYIGRNFGGLGGSGGNSTIGLVENYTARVAGNDLAIGVARTLTAAEISVAAVAVGAAAWAGYEAGTHIADYFGLGPRCTARDSSGNWVCDAGITQPTVSGFKAMYGTTPGTGTTQTGACSSWRSLHPDSGSYTVSYNATLDRCELFYEASMVDTAVITTSTFSQCPASIDALNPAYSVAEGAAPDVDGKCRTGSYTSATDSEVQARVQAYGNPAYLAEVGEQVLIKGQPITTASARTVSGPASVTGATTTTVSGDVTTTKTPTTNYSYATNTVTYNVSNVTTVNNAGDITTTTTTEVPEETDQCKANPTSAGCVKLGDAPEAVVPKSDIPISLTPVTFSSASCPASVSWSAFGVSRSFAFTPLCDAASTWIHGVIMLIATAIAGFIFIGGLKS